MKLHAGYMLCVAPRFHSRLAWSERVRINSGVEGVAGRFLPRDDWRAPNAEELVVLLGGPSTTGGAAEAMLPPTHAGLLTVPPHVCAAWWGLAEGLRPASFQRDRSPLDRCAVPSQASDSDSASSGLPAPRMDGYDAFVAGLVEFLRFKRLPLPERCQFDVVASRPGQRSTRVDPAGALAGLGFSCGAADVSASRLVAAINLGDEASCIVLLNLPPPAMQALAADASAATLCADFFSSLPDYPLVQLRLDPGDGLWLPDGPVVSDGYTMEKRDVDVALMIRSAGTPSPDSGDCR